MAEENGDISLDMSPEQEDVIKDEIQEGGNNIPREEPKTLGRSALIAFVVAIIIAIVVLLLQSGDSGSIPGRSGPAIRPPGDKVEHLHPCEIISSSELEAILGTSISRGAELSTDNPLGEMLCGFNSEDLEEPLVLISIFHTDMFEPFMQNAEYTVAHLFDGNRGAEGASEVVDDLGDRAYWGGAGGNPWNGLHVLLGNAYLHVGVPSGEHILAQAEAEDLSRILLTRIQ